MDWHIFSNPIWQSPSGVARALPGRWVAHPESQNEEENEKSVRKSKKQWSKFGEKMRKVELLPTRDCEAGYSPAVTLCDTFWLNLPQGVEILCGNVQWADPYKIDTPQTEVL